jgi:hypothetical protein
VLLTRQTMVKVTALLIAAAVGALVAYAVISPASPSVRGRVLPGIPGDVEQPVLRMFDTSQPLMPNGEKTSLTSAEERGGNQLFVPDPAPSQDSPEVWFDGASDEVAIRYGSTLVLTYDLWEAGQDPASEYAQQATDWNVGDVTTISGNPAWVIDKDAQAESQPPVAEVHVALGAWDITLFGDMSTDELTQIAASLQPAHSGSLIPGGGA